ncbi:hypothetical protein [Vibrio gigantis]|uniref:EpsG family protein n=1 Tax=Vibrio gigantis TaxID=296199 RepID=A0A5M9NKP6_9VIBR|nr:hypothetical protein [Vibrio gigantis]KAA8671173.1 hypothetical protein F4W18_16720 [Vibrio gigantis]
MNRKTFIVILLLLSLTGLVLGFGLKDYDHLLTRNELSLHTLIIQFLNPPSIILILFNLLIISYALSVVCNKNIILFVLLIINPFLLTNTFDAYNKFAFIVFFLLLVEYISSKRRNFVYLTSFFSILIHPTLVFSNYYYLFSSKKNIKYLLLICFFILLSFSFIHDYLLEYSDKYQSFINNDGSMANLYDGNTKVLKEFSDFNFQSIVARFIAFIFPFGFIIDSSIIFLIFGFYNVVTLGFLFLQLRFEHLITLLFTYLVVVVAVGNFAVAQRHMLPIILFFVVISDRKLTLKF